MTLVEGHPLIERKTTHTHPNSHLCERKTTHTHPSSRLCERKTAHAARKRSKMSHFQRMWAKNISFSCRHLDILRSRGDQNFIPRLYTVSRHTSFRNNPLGKTRKPNDALYISEFSTDATTSSVIHRHDLQACAVKDAPPTVEPAKQRRFPAGGPDMTPDRIASVRSALLNVDENNTAVCLHRRHKTGEILRITAGVYIETKAFADLNPRDCQALVFAARLCALSVRHPSYTLSGPAIASLLGLPVTGSLETLIVYVPSRSCSRLVHFPEIVIDDNMRIPSARISTCRPSHPVSSIEYLGFRIATPARVLVDCARLLSDKRGFPIACAGLARACHFDRFHQEASRDREDEARREFHQALDDTPRNARGRRHARWIIDHADAGCESPGEALVLLALLHAGINGLATQEEVHIDGHTYFIDIALPDLKIAIEFDGRIKYGETVDQVHDSIEAEQRRQRDLERAGWKVIRVRWSDLTLINEVVAQVLVAIRAKVGR